MLSLELHHSFPPPFNRRFIGQCYATVRVKLLTPYLTLHRLGKEKHQLLVTSPRHTCMLSLVNTSPPTGLHWHLLKERFSFQTTPLPGCQISSALAFFGGNGGAADKFKGRSMLTNNRFELSVAFNRHLKNWACPCHPC